jgi:hypothetical protein
MSDSDEGESETRKSVFPKFEPGKPGRNLLWTVFYGVVYPVGSVAMIYGFIRNYRDDKEREMGLGENLLTLWLGLFVFLLVLATILGSLSAVGVIPEDTFSDDSSSTDPAASTATASDDTVRCWLANHQDEMEEARQQLEDGRSALEAGDGSRSLMHLEKAVKRYESLNESAHEAPLRNETRERLIEGYFYATYQGTAAAYLGVYELQVNDDAAAAERKAELAEQYADTASQRRQALKESLGVSQSTYLSEISADC